jgi:ATP-dependent helicase HrpA
VSTPSPAVAELRERLSGVTIRDRERLGRRLDGVRRRQPKARERLLADIARQVQHAEQVVAGRVAARPEVRYPDLPITARRDDIAAAVGEHQVVVVAGETGSGKTTQIPKICLELGRGVRGTIGHTQPRRLAARTVAQRIADELGTPLGEAVGYTVRFTDQVSERTLVKLMTDGVLLAEIQRDRRLLRYDTLIIDEAHERSLNIDFLLGYLTELLPRRPDLKVIITSATIDPHRFAAHFGGAPVVEVSGRNYPVEIRYRPLEPEPTSSDDDDDPDDPDHEVVHRIASRDQTEAILDAVRELSAEGSGDILVFLNGEREIRDTAEILRALDLPDTDVLALYARLATAEQQLVFAPHTRRRLVLSTNVAETSLTVPGVRYVIDPGTARISRYSRRTKVQRLPIEAVSQASAAQRAGRCGRVAEGICIRLYSESDFAARPPFTEPEILRTNLAAVILQMAALGLGDVERFPFLDPPDRRNVRDGVALLQELGAFDAEGALTDIGRRLAQLPVDPRLARMILQAEAEGCVREMLALAAALTINDPRERPSEQLAAAQQQHARFADEHSDFVSYLRLWDHLQERRRELSGNQFRRMCRAEFLHYLRVREWQDMVGQLRTIARSLGIVESDQPAAPEQVHSAVLAGLLSHLGLRTADGREYQGARNSRFVIAPGSVLSRRPPRWVMVAELVETSRLFGRIAARVEPESAERIAGHLVTRSYSEPHWDAARGAAMAYERVLLYGLPLVARRRVGYAGIDPQAARELFVRHALVEGDWSARHRFLQDNQALLGKLAELEDRTRRRDIVAGDDELFAFYDARIPAGIVSARHFDTWWKNARRDEPDLLSLRAGDLLSAAGELGGYPDVWQAGDLALPLSYRFEPGAADDGVTVRVPVDVLARLGGQEFGWQVPALRAELVTALIRALPKDLRRNFLPVPDTVRAVLAGMVAGREPLIEAVQRELYRYSAVLVPLDAFDLNKVPDHLRLSFAVEDTKHNLIGHGKDLAALQVQLAAPARAAVAEAAGAELERTGLRDWPADLNQLPRVVEHNRGGHAVRGFPALVEEGDAVAVRVFATESEQAAAMGAGARRLVRLSAPSPVKAVQAALSTRTRLLLAANPDGSLAALLDDCTDAAIDSLTGADRPFDRAAFAELRSRVAAGLQAATADVFAQVQLVLAAAHDVRAALPALPPPAQAESVADIRAQLVALLPPGFVVATGRARLGDLVRYVTALARRLERMPRDVAMDRARMQRVHHVQQAYADLLRAIPQTRAAAEDVTDIRWLIEELRVSLYAQQLGTARPVSEQRIYRAIDAVAP